MTHAHATDAHEIASRHIELWSGKVPNRRRDILAATWTSDAQYVGPLTSTNGHDGIDAMIAGASNAFPNSGSD